MHYGPAQPVWVDRVDTPGDPTHDNASCAPRRPCRNPLIPLRVAAASDAPSY
jgi:hypothetical protein